MEQVIKDENIEIFASLLEDEEEEDQLLQWLELYDCKIIKACISTLSSIDRNFEEKQTSLNILDQCVELCPQVTRQIMAKQPYFIKDGVLDLLNQAEEKKDMKTIIICCVLIMELCSLNNNFDWDETNSENLFNIFEKLIPLVELSSIQTPITCAIVSILVIAFPVPSFISYLGAHDSVKFFSDAFLESFNDGNLLSWSLSLPFLRLVFRFRQARDIFSTNDTGVILDILHRLLDRADPVVDASLLLRVMDTIHVVLDHPEVDPKQYQSMMDAMASSIRSVLAVEEISQECQEKARQLKFQVSRGI
eukprot:gb/GECH01003796.1/.p1 GENE.gb/GECH01003796.1/~~gb/GECH01003796.1/.p1  ORF type:complete len:306 (+),score=84.63 gb/GECH01003796.1/:1-918(+)